MYKGVDSLPIIHEIISSRHNNIAWAKQKWGRVSGGGWVEGGKTMGRRRPLSRFMFGVTSRSRWLPQFSPARALPSWCSSWFSELEQRYCFGVSSFHLLSILSVSFWFLSCIPLYNPYMESGTPHLSASSLGLSFSPTSVLWSEFGLKTGFITGGAQTFFQSSCFYIAPAITGERSSCYASWLVMG